MIDPRPAANPAAEIQRARAIAAGLAPRSVERLAELVECADGKVALVACEAVRKWTVEEPKIGEDTMPKTTPAAFVAYRDRCAQAMALREGLRVAMPGASEEEFWTALASRLHAARHRLSEAFSIEEIRTSVLADVRAEWSDPHLPMPVSALPLPLRDRAFRRLLDPNSADPAATGDLDRILEADPRDATRRELVDALSSDLGPRPGDTLV